MIDLFRVESNLNVGIMRPPEWPFIERGFQKNIDKVIDFHHTYNRGVKSNHFLIRLLHSIGVPKTLELERYYALVDAMSLNLSMHFKMTSSIYKGTFHKGIFYGNDNPEILLATDDYFDFDYVDRNWKTVNAVTTLIHPKSDMELHLPNGEAYSNENGLAIILINVTMLAVQYRAFWREQQRKPDDAPTKSIMQFIGGYVIPNMLPKQTDICFFNRLVNRFYKIEDGLNIPFRSHSFMLTDYSKYIDLAIDKILINIEKTNKRFDVVLKQIPSFYNEDMLKTLMVPDFPPTVQVSWSILLSRLKSINFLFDICSDHLTSRNQFSINQVLRAFRLNNSYSMFNDMLPDALYYQAQEMTDNILDAVNRNAF
jgi:hypothetical protein